MEQSSKVEYKSLTDIYDLCMFAYRYERNELSLDKIYEIISKHFVLGYEVWVDNEIKAISYSLCINGVYTLDGHNYGASVFFASTAGKMVVRDLFDGYTTMVMTTHGTDERHLHVLVKRIGFKFWFEFEGSTQFYMVK